MSDDSSSSPGGGTSVAPTIDILISAPEWRAAGCVEMAEAAARAALDDNRWRAAGVVFDVAELSIELAGDARVATLNAAFRGRHVPTNVLAFPAIGATDLPAVFGSRTGGRPILLGDIVVAHGVAAAEAARAGIGLSHHLAHLIVHGTLHCLGYDHETEASAAEMESLEVRILARLGVADPYVDSSPMDAVQ